MKTPPQFDPKARVAVQVELDPVERKREDDKLEEMQDIVQGLKRIELIFQRIAAALERLSPPLATKVSVTESDIPRTEP